DPTPGAGEGTPQPPHCPRSTRAPLPRWRRRALPGLRAAPSTTVPLYRLPPFAPPGWVQEPRRGQQLAATRPTTARPTTARPTTTLELARPVRDSPPPGRSTMREFARAGRDPRHPTRVLPRASPAPPLPPRVRYATNVQVATDTAA